VASLEITPELVVSAYRATGMRPMRGELYHYDGHGWCGCAAGAILFALGGGGDARGRWQAWSIGRQAYPEYLDGFTSGFDCVPPMDPIDSPEVRRGIKDGIACRVAVIREPGVAL